MLCFFIQGEGLDEMATTWLQLSCATISFSEYLCVAYTCGIVRTVCVLVQYVYTSTSSYLIVFWHLNMQSVDLEN